MENPQAPVITGINAFSPKNIRAVLTVKKANFRSGIQSKESFKQYLRTPGSSDDPDSNYSWINDGMNLPTSKYFD
jgi:hypothetical protein